jgi:hypothetical protein
MPVMIGTLRNVANVAAQNDALVVTNPGGTVWAGAVAVEAAATLEGQSQKREPGPRKPLWWIFHPKVARIAGACCAAKKAAANVECGGSRNVDGDCTPLSDGTCIDGFFCGQGEDWRMPSVLDSSGGRIV